MRAWNQEATYMPIVLLENPGEFTCKHFSPGPAWPALSGLVFIHRICRGSPEGVSAGVVGCAAPSKMKIYKEVIARI